MSKKSHLPPPTGAPQDLSSAGLDQVMPKAIPLQTNPFAGASTLEENLSNKGPGEVMEKLMAYDDLKAGEATGKMKTSPVMPEEPAAYVPEAYGEVIDNPAMFQMAIGNAQMEGAEYIEVSERLFKYLIKNTKSKYLTYGEPGVKVYQVGTREDIEAEESMSAENYHNYIAKKKQRHGIL